MAYLYPIQIDRGSYYALQVNYVNASGQPIDLTSYSARMTFRDIQSVTGNVALGPLTPGSGITLNSPAVGSLTISVSATQSIAMTILQGFYDLFLDPDGSEDASSVRVMQGPFIVSDRVSS